MFPALGRSCSKNKEGLGFPASFLAVFPLCSQTQACVFLLPLITSFQLCTPRVFDTVWGPQTFPFLSLAPNCNRGLTSCLDVSPEPNYMPVHIPAPPCPHHCLLPPPPPHIQIHITCHCKRKKCEIPWKDCRFCSQASLGLNSNSDIF